MPLWLKHEEPSSADDEKRDGKEDTKKEKVKVCTPPNSPTRISTESETSIKMPIKLNKKTSTKRDNYGECIQKESNDGSSGLFLNPSISHNSDGRQHTEISLPVKQFTFQTESNHQLQPGPVKTLSHVDSCVLNSASRCNYK